MLKKSFMASFLIAIIVLMPFYSSLTLASINSVTVKGKDNVPNMVRTKDDLNIEAEFSEQVSKENVKFRLGEEHTPDQCDSECSLTLQNHTTQPSEHEISVYRYNNGAVADQFTGNYYAESSGPVIEELSLQEEGNYTLETSIRDETCNNCECAGPKRLEITKDYNLTNTLDLDSSSCSSQFTFTLSKEELGLAEGSNEICFIPYDKIGNKGEKVCIQETVDTTKPDLESFRLQGDKGDKIEYISNSESIDATAIANLSESNLTTVTADFSEFNTILGQGYKNMEGNCERTSSENYQCTWDIKIRGEEGQMEYSLEATDTESNTAVINNSISLSVDNSAPEVKGIYNNRQIPTEEIYMKEGNNKIWAEFGGSGSGYLKKKVYMDIMLGSTMKNDQKADGCTYEDDSWFCYWNINAPSSGSVTLNKDTKDDAGNRLKEELTKEVKLDKEEPEILHQNLKTQCPYAGQHLVIDFRIKDKTPVSITTTPQRITTGNKIYKAECNPQSENTHSCTLEIENLVSKHETENLNLKIADAAANENSASQDVEVCQKVSGQAPFNVKMDYSVTGRLDRKMLSFVSLPIVANIELEPEDGIALLEKKASCDNYIKNTRLLNQQGNNPQLVARVKKKAANKDANSSEISFSCSLDLTARQGNKVYSQPLTKQLNLSVPNNKVGGIDDTVQDKIDSIEDDIEEVEKDIKDYEEWNKWLSMLCSIGETIAKLNAVMGMVKSTVYIVALGMTQTCGTGIGEVSSVCEAGWGLWSTVCGWTSAYNVYATDIVWYPSFLTGWASTGQYVKTFCMIYSCKLCTLDYAQTTADMTGMDSKFIRVAGGVTTGFSTQTLSGIGGGFAQGALTAWGEGKQKPNHLSVTLGGAKMDPFRSIHAARACLCIPGILYNLKKDKQIKCMYKNCLQERAQEGLPTDVCDEAYRMRECLYVEGAQWKVLGSNEFFSFFENMLGTIIRNMPLIVAAEAWGGSCGLKYEDLGCATMIGSPLSVYDLARQNLACHVSGAALQVMQVGGFKDAWNKDKYSGKLEGDTVC